MPPEGAGLADLLIVDDARSNLLSLEALLDDVAEHVWCATSGTEALRALLTHDFRLIILDVQMPHMDGFETARLIRKRARSRHTPIIFMTGHSYEHLKANDVDQLAPVEFLIKPVPPGLLRAKVIELLGLQHRAL